MSALRPLLLLPLLLAGCAKGGLPNLSSIVPTVAFHKLKFEDLSFEGTTAEFVFNVDNPNPIGLDLASLDWALALSGNPFLDGNHGSPVSVSPQDKSKVRLPVSLKWADALSVGQALKGADEIPWSMSGDFRFSTPLGPIGLPFEQAGQLPMLHAPRIRLEALRVERLDLAKQTASLALDLGIDSDQQTTLSFDAFDYDVKLKGTSVASGNALVGAVAGSKDITLPIDLNLLNLGAVIVEAITNKSQLQVGLSADAQIGTPLGPVPLSISESGPLQLR